MSEQSKTLSKGDAGHPHGTGPGVVHLSGRAFVIGCIIAAAVMLVIGRYVDFPAWLLALEVFATVIGLFVLGSFKYQIHKNPLTYGMLLVISATFAGLPATPWHEEIAEHGWSGWMFEHLLSFRGLDHLIHLDTMLFILGLTFFVAVIAQTRLLEGVTFFLLGRNGGFILPTVIQVTAVVAFFSGILDGVSMIGLTMRTLFILMLMACAPTPVIRYSVMVCTLVTTVCGIWLAYGEPPNLIMKANLFPYLDNQFFLRYCAPAAIASFGVVVWQLRRRLKGWRVDLAGLDVIDSKVQDVCFLQAARHGEVLNPVEFAEEHKEELGHHFEAVMKRLHAGESLGLALVREKVDERIRLNLLGGYVSEGLAESLDRHYELQAAGDLRGAKQAEEGIDKVLLAMSGLRRRSQWIGVLALAPFIGMLIWHAIDHDVPLFFASFAGFAVALTGIFKIEKMRRLALRDARREFSEYYFLLPLFFSVSLLTEAGFFAQLQAMIDQGIRSLGHSHLAVLQFLGISFLSATLDNNVVADFASRALHHLDIAVLHLLAMSQIAGYAVGGCWTHIGSAQSVVSFAFIRRDVDEHYTPVQWIKEMTPIILEIAVVMIVLIYLEGALLKWLQ